MTITETRIAHEAMAPTPGRGAPVVVAAAWAISLAMGVLIAFVPLDRSVIGALVLALTICLLMTGLPIAIAMFLGAALGVWAIAGPVALTAIAGETIFSSAAQWSLSVIPGFVLMGSLLWKSGMTDRLFQAARLWLGGLPGGLAVGSNFAGAGLASISGSTIGVTYALGRVALPAMLDAGYNKRLATGTVSIVGALGQLIPPSILLVVYAGVAQTPVGPQLLAAIVPALIIAFAFAGLIIVRCILNPSLAPKEKVDTGGPAGLFGSLAGVIPVFLLFLGVVGGMFLGIFTATEAAAFGVIAAAVIAWVFNPAYRQTPRLFLTHVKNGLIEAVAATATIFLLLTAVNMLTRAMSISQLTTHIADFAVSLELSRVGFLLILVVVYIILGLFLEPMAMILLTVPILLQPLEHYGIDLIWFGVFVLILGEVAQVSPPVGIMSFIVHRLAQEPEVNRGVHISLGDVFRGAIPFVVTTLLVLLVLIFFPGLTEILQPIQ